MSHTPDDGDGSSRNHSQVTSEIQRHHPQREDTIKRHSVDGRGVSVAWDAVYMKTKVDSHRVDALELLRKLALEEVNRENLF